MCGSDVALCQIILTSLVYHAVIQHDIDVVILSVRLCVCATSDVSWKFSLWKFNKFRDFLKNFSCHDLESFVERLNFLDFRQLLLIDITYEWFSTLFYLYSTAKLSTVIKHAMTTTTISMRFNQLFWKSWNFAWNFQWNFQWIFHRENCFFFNFTSLFVTCWRIISLKRCKRVTLLRHKQHDFHRRCPVILNKKFVLEPCGGRLGARPPGRPLELPLVWEELRLCC